MHAHHPVTGCLSVNCLIPPNGVFIETEGVQSGASTSTRCSRTNHTEEETLIVYTCFSVAIPVMASIDPTSCSSNYLVSERIRVWSVRLIVTSGHPWNHSRIAGITKASII